MKITPIFLGSLYPRLLIIYDKNLKNILRHKFKGKEKMWNFQVCDLFSKLLNKYLKILIDLFKLIQFKSYRRVVVHLTHSFYESKPPKASIKPLCENNNPFS